MTRRVEITVLNNTKYTMHVKRKELKHGKWRIAPVSVGSDESLEFQAEKETGALYGVEGLVQYECNKGLFTIKFEKPYGKSDSFIKVTDEHGVVVEVYGVIKTSEVISGTVKLEKIL